MTDAEATALCELAACPDHRREARPDDRFKVAAYPAGWYVIEAAYSEPPCLPTLVTGPHLTQRRAQRISDYMNANH